MTELEDLRHRLSERDQQIRTVEAELSSLKGSRLFRLRNAVVEPWSLGKVRRLGRLAASLLTPGWIKRHVRSLGSRSGATTRTGTSAQWEERFDPDLYRALYPDIDATGADPRKHFAVYGRTEGRVGWLDRTLDLGGLEQSRPTALVVFHEGSRTGAPVLGYTLVRRLLRQENVVALFYKSGPMMAACKDAGALVIGPDFWRNARFPPGDAIFRLIIEQVAPQSAIINSVESRHIARALAELYVPTISLIHEFSAYTRPLGALTEVAFWSGETVFSARITRDSAWASDPALSGIDFPIISQGRCDLPEEVGRDSRGREDEAALIRRVLRPPGFPPNGIVVLGLGFVHARKGVDLFIECANRVRELAPDLPIRFVWIGKFDTEGDPGYSGLLADQIRRAQLDGKLAMLDEVANLTPAYESADLFVLSSRLDPLPNVAIDAMCAGLPVLCFDRASGISEILTENGLGDLCVASYLSPESMARKMIALGRSPELRRRASADSSRLAARIFDMDRYVSRLQDLLEHEKSRARQEHRDAASVARSGLLRGDFLRRPAFSHESDADTVRAYVRAWSRRIGRRKPFPGFHPGIYLEKHGVKEHGADPLADYIREGRPRGPWDFDVVTPGGSPPAIPQSLRIGLHIHVHYPDLLEAILERLERNQTPIDLLVSATTGRTYREASSQLATYRGGSVDVREVPNRGRDIGPLLTEFAAAISARFDIIGHVHTKRSTDLADSRTGEEWSRFLLENMLGGQARMADEILSRMAADPGVGMVFPDEPNIIGWTQNRSGAQELSDRLGLGPIPDNPVFPVGSMFWARVTALRPLLGLGLTWQDYPEEPVPYDGTLLHVIERLLPMVATSSGASILLSNVPGVTR